MWVTCVTTPRPLGENRYPCRLGKKQYRAPGELLPHRSERQASRHGRVDAAPERVESLRPDQVLLDPFGRIVLDPTVMLLPVPLPAGAPLRPTLASAPELGVGQADARSDLYCFGAPHPGAMNAVFADGSVRRIRYDVSLGVFQDVCRPNDGNPTSLDDL